MLPSKSKWNLARTAAWLVLPLIWSLAAVAQPPANDQPSSVPSNEATSVASTITTLPKIEREIHDAMQSKSYGEAVKLIETTIASGKSEAADYLRYLQGIALTENENYDDAIETFEQLERDFPESPWISRSRFGRANVYVLRRQYIDAGQIYQREAERLLSQDRKDTLAQIYLEFADRYFEAHSTA